MVDLKDSGSRSGVIWAGKVRIMTANKLDYIDLTVNSSGNLLLTNRAGKTVIVTLT